MSTWVQNRSNMADKVDKHTLKELLPFLCVDAREDLKFFALDYIKGLTGSEDGKRLLKENEEFLKQLLDLTQDSSKEARRNAYVSLVNLSAEVAIAEKILRFGNIKHLIACMVSTDDDCSDSAAMILSNMTRTAEASQEVLNVTASNPEECGLYKVVEALCKENHNPKAKLHYLATFLSNLTQLQEARDFILDRKRCVVQRLLPFTQYERSLVRRGGVVGTLRNCSFETDSHEWLLSDDVDILPHLLLPLAGPEEFDEEDMEKLPPDLQYLEETKTREEDPQIRQMLLEALLQLCATKHGRTIMSNKNVYVILREHHKWEEDEEAKSACLKAIQVLISDEPEPGMENLREVEIPENVKFDEENSTSSQQ